MTASAMLGTMSGVLAGHVVGNYDGGIVPVNLFIQQIGATGSGKSRSHDAVVRPVHELQERTIRSVSRRRDVEIRPRILQLEAKLAQAKRKLADDPEAFEIAQHTAHLERRLENERSKDLTRQFRFIVDDATPQAREAALADALRNAIFVVTADGRPHLEAMISSKGKPGEAERNVWLRGYSGDPLHAIRVTKHLNRRAERATISCLFGIQPDIAERFWQDRLLRMSGVLGRFLAFTVEGEQPGCWLSAGGAINEASASWKRHIGIWRHRTLANRSGAPLEISFTPGAMERLKAIRHPFEDAGVPKHSLRDLLAVRWRENAARMAVVLAALKEIGASMPEVTENDVEAACRIVFRAHLDTYEIIHLDDRTPDEAERDDLKLFLMGHDGPLHVVSRNASGLSVARLKGLAEKYPEVFEIVPERTGLRGQPKKVIRLCGQEPTLPSRDERETIQK
ncbi:DUF3987 domain-containing protein [Haloferula sp. A504]|uniref:DUF3987 domain-containing protein n=1 Tax=Haloferula sp. A504 TaxID=3373601 RepID=UPI0031CB62ED|nr:DUF3987 domain-containing protein [Verrucomicrobiaceae bacterium E54]